MEKFLVVRFSSLGDIVLSSVVTQELSQAFPQAEIVYLTKSKYVSMAEFLPGVSRVLGLGEGQNFWRLVNLLRKQKFDCLIDLHANWRSFWIRHLLKAKLKLKYHSRRARRILMTVKPNLPIKPLSTAQLYLETLSPLGISGNGAQSSLTLKARDREEAARFLLERNSSDGSKFIGIAPGARWKNKRWHAERFLQVGESLQEKQDARLIIFGAREESDVVGEIERGLGGAISAVGLEYNLVAALIERCSLFVTNDSGLMHIASALHVPTIAIFGPTHPKLGFAPQGLHTDVVTTDQPCSPCSLHGRGRCFQPVRICMDSITPEMVLKSASALLERNRTVPASDEK